MGPGVPDSSLARAKFFFSARKYIGNARWPRSLGLLIEPRPHHCSPTGRVSVHSAIKTQMYLVLALVEENAIQRIVALLSGCFAGSKRHGVGR